MGLKETAHHEFKSTKRKLNDATNVLIDANAKGAAHPRNRDTVFRRLILRNVTTSPHALDVTSVGLKLYAIDLVVVSNPNNSVHRHQCIDRASRRAVQ